MTFENYQPKIIGHILKNKQNNKCVCIHEIMWWILMEIKMQVKRKSHRYEINRPSSRNKHKYSKYKKCLNVSIHGRVKQYWGWIEKRVAFKKSV